MEGKQEEVARYGPELFEKWYSKYGRPRTVVQESCSVAVNGGGGGRDGSPLKDEAGAQN